MTSNDRTFHGKMLNKQFNIMDQNENKAFPPLALTQKVLLCADEVLEPISGSLHVILRQGSQPGVDRSQVYAIHEECLKNPRRNLRNQQPIPK
jgi:hypothetical protein